MSKAPWKKQTTGWKTGLSHLLEFYIEFNHSKIPQHYKSPDGYDLGKWSRNVRAAKKGQINSSSKDGKGRWVLTDQQINQLNAMNFWWGTTNAKIPPIKHQIIIDKENCFKLESVSWFMGKEYSLVANIPKNLESLIEKIKITHEEMIVSLIKKDNREKYDFRVFKNPRYKNTKPPFISNIPVTPENQNGN
jgi:Helicase associated domain